MQAIVSFRYIGGRWGELANILRHSYRGRFQEVNAQLASSRALPGMYATATTHYCKAASKPCATVDNLLIIGPSSPVRPEKSNTVPTTSGDSTACFHEMFNRFQDGMIVRCMFASFFAQDTCPLEMSAGRCVCVNVCTAGRHHKNSNFDPTNAYLVLVTDEASVHRRTSFRRRRHGAHETKACFVHI